MQSSAPHAGIDSIMWDLNNIINDIFDAVNMWDHKDILKVSL